MRGIPCREWTTKKRLRKIFIYDKKDKSEKNLEYNSIEKNNVIGKKDFFCDSVIPSITSSHRDHYKPRAGVAPSVPRPATAPVRSAGRDCRQAATRATEVISNRFGYIYGVTWFMWESVVTKAKKTQHGVTLGAVGINHRPHLSPTLRDLRRKHPEKYGMPTTLDLM